jgi:hypothetical protein
MLSTTDKTVIDNNNDKDNQITKSIVIGYNSDTAIYAFTMLSGVHDTSFALNNMPSKINWVYGDRWNCSYAFTKCSHANYFQKNTVRICSACYEYYKSATKISKSEYDTYIRDIILPTTPKFISGFSKNNRYFICLKTHKTNHFVIIGKREDELTQEEKYEVIKRKYIRRLLMFARIDLIPEIIGIIAVMVIQ